MLDPSETERWKLSLSVAAFDLPNANGQSIPLKELNTDIIVLWIKAENRFSIEKPAEPPPADLAAFPGGTDGVSRTIIRYIMRGQDQLLAYTTTRVNLPGTRFLVVRMHQDREPQSLETPDRDAATAKWNDWYQEWKSQGFGGASGNGLDRRAALLQVIQLRPARTPCTSTESNILILRSRMTAKAPGFNPAKTAHPQRAFRPGASPVFPAREPQ